MELKNRFEIRLRYQSFDKKAVELLKKNIQNLTKDIISFSFVRLPERKKRITLLRSPHVNKKSREQLEIRFYNGLILLKVNFLCKSLLQQLSQLSNSVISLKISFHTLHISSC
jgi:small subunit ribosomal protein S10